MSSSSDTPMMRQYTELKEQHKDAVLFFRMGDFYEMFRSEAVEVSKILEINLTQRQGIPMCGIPYHASKTYIGRLLKAGKKIAICEQTALPEKGKGIAKREVVEVITPGTVVDETYLEQLSNNYLAAIAINQGIASFSYVDLSTGEFFTTSTSQDVGVDFVKKELARVSPRELIIQESLVEKDIRYRFIEESNIYLNRMADWYWDLSTAIRIISKHFGTNSLKGFGFSDSDPSLLTAGIILQYLEENSGNYLAHIRTLKSYSDSDFLSLDEASQKNLELVKNLHDGSRSFTLIEVLDKTCSAIGARQLKKWILFPLINIEQLQERLNRVDFLYRNQTLLSSFRELIKKVFDLERLASRISMQRAHGKDLIAIKNSLKVYLAIIELIVENSDFIDGKNGLKNWFIMDPDKAINQIKEIYQLIELAVDDEPSILITEGKLIKDGFNDELDKLRKFKNNSKDILDEYRESEKINSGINNLKIKYNKIIGYFFEVSKGQLDQVPTHFIRRQSLVGSERFTTEKLGELEVDLKSSTDKIYDLEKELFLDIRSKLEPHVSILHSASDLLADLDCYQSLAYVATTEGLVKPNLNQGTELNIVNGRHPVVEYHLPAGDFVPNSINLNSSDVSFALITGPNMAGKSTFLRQTALISLMAQIGSFVPADKAEIGLIDRIFCRVGATDNLARGESTFLVEMNETANILRNSTSNSLIIMDEVGRGTSTEDGLAIAWGVCDYLLAKIGARTLFATHYHELTRLNHEKLKNLSLAVKEEGDSIVFLKKIIDGAADHSYGLHVASLAGVPIEIINRAKEVLSIIDKDKIEALENITEMKIDEPTQMSLFSAKDIILDELKSFNINNCTPLEALNRINFWKDQLKN